MPWICGWAGIDLQSMKMTEIDLKMKEEEEKEYKIRISEQFKNGVLSEKRSDSLGMLISYITQE